VFFEVVCKSTGKHPKFRLHTPEKNAIFVALLEK